MASTKPRIGLIGVGLMGHGIGKNLVEKGFPLTILGHRNRAPVEDLVARGAVEADSPADAARRSDILLICVTGSVQVDELFHRPDGILSAARDGLIVVDTSTSEPDATARLAEELAGCGAILVDAPLARTPVEAEAGRLNTMVGAAPEIFERVKPVFAAYCENIFHVGAPGAGHKLKLINNFLSLGVTSLFAEAIIVAAKAGLDVGKLYDVVSMGPVANGLLKILVPKAIAGEFDGMKFQLANGQKDLRYYTHLAESLGVTSSLGDSVHQGFVLASALGFGDRFVPSLIEAQAQINGVDLSKLGGPAT
ncbi:MAG: 6-phosphogluconate dehydrogenase [Rhodospirillales bacterium]|jgi:3-hydroxyisobutyrate dehydrogenase-like beta-hydroxyacid dehydrogenase|nr:6-phosphogluconate dehydrogenase [Rhodospirillales bacterium]